MCQLSRNSVILKVLQPDGPIQDSDGIYFFRKCKSYLLQPFIFELRHIFKESGCLYFLNSQVLHWYDAGSSGAVGWGTALQIGRSPVRFPMVSLEIFHWHNSSGRTMALGLIQPLTEMSTRNISLRCVIPDRPDIDSSTRSTLHGGWPTVNHTKAQLKIPLYNLGWYYWTTSIHPHTRYAAAIHD